MQKINIAEYHWKALNRFEQKQRGKSLALSALDLEKQLLSKGYRQINISRNFVIPQRPKGQEITQLIEQLALLVQAAIPLKQALNMILENCQHIRLYQWIWQLISDLESGFSLSQALEKGEAYLPVQEIQLIKMGELSGTLGTVLKNIAAAREKSEKLAKKVKKILFYPVIVLGISLSLSVLLLLFIVPQFVELYGEKNQSLPWITAMLFSLSHFLQENRYTLCLLMIMLYVAFSLLAKKTRIITTLKGQLLNHLPVFNQILRHSRIIFFCQNCALMLNAHIRLDNILTCFIDNKQLDHLLQRESAFCLNLLKQGYRFHEGLNPSVFNNDVVQMVAIGEQSSNLAPMLEHIGHIYQQRLDYQVDILSQLLEPMLMLLMGVIVGTIIVGLYLPIFDMGAMME